MPHAWKACGQTLTLRRQLESMPDGGLFAMAAPPDPFPLPARAIRTGVPDRRLFQAIQAAGRRSRCSTPRIRLPGRIYSRMRIVGYTAGPSIASAWGLRRSSSPRRSATAEPDANVSDGSPAARRAYPQMPLAPAPNPTSGPTAAPPVQPLDDSRSTFMAYVPIGSLAKGEALEAVATIGVAAPYAGTARHFRLLFIASAMSR